MIRKTIAAPILLILVILLTIAAAATAVWQQANSSGFGDPLAEEVSALAVFNGNLYAGIRNPTNNARIFRSPDGAAWTPVIAPGFGSDHDTAPPAVLDLTVFNGRLYAGTGGGNAAQIWRTVDGVNWARVVNAGFGDPDVVDISALAEYNGLIYAGATSSVSGAQIWRSFTGDSNSWTQVAPAVAGTAAARVTGLVVFDGALYAAVASEEEAPLQIWRSYGGAWTAVVDDGFGNANTTKAGGMAVFGGKLYVGAGNKTSGAQLWRTADGDTWEPAGAPGFGDAHNQSVEAVTVFQNALYVSVSNAQSGLEVWRSADGAQWEQDNQDGFGNGHNAGSNGSNATAVFGDRLYVGTANAVDGGELWRKQPASSVSYGVALSPDDALMGTAGETVTYTLSLTNTGTTADTFALAAAGHRWSTALSAPSITLNAGANTTFTAAVTIPADAADGAADAVTVTATSQGDTAVVDSAVLTTTCDCPAAVPSWKVYVPVIFWGA